MPTPAQPSSDETSSRLHRPQQYRGDDRGKRVGVAEFISLLPWATGPWHRSRRISVDTWKLYDLTHRDHVIWNPTSTGKLDELIELLDLGPSRGCSTWLPARESSSSASRSGSADLRVRASAASLSTSRRSAVPTFEHWLLAGPPTPK